jgi:hypothetical protein
MNNNSKDLKVKESMVVRGICASIQAMQMPTFENLAELLKKFGYALSKINHQ